MAIFPEGGGGGADFANLNDHIAVAGNLSSAWTSSTQVLTISGSTFTGNNIAGASDVTINAVADGHILIRSGNAFINKAVSGDLTISTTGVTTLAANSVSGAKISDRGVALSKIDTTGKNSGDLIEVNSNSGVEAVTRQTVVNSVLIEGNNVDITTSGSGVVITSSSTIRGATDSNITSIVSGHILIWDGNDWVNRSVAGDITISSNGNTQLSANTVGPTELIVSGNGEAGQHLTSGGDGTLRWTNPPSGGGSGVTTLSALTDVTLTSPSNGQVLKFNGTNWVNGTDNTGGGGGGSTTFSGLSDTDVASPSSGDIVLFNNGTLYNEAMSGDATIDAYGELTIGAGKVTDAKLSSNVVLSSLGNVSSTAPTTNQVLKWNGTSWAPANDATGGGGGGSGITTSNLLEGNGVTIAKSGDNATFSSNAGKTKRFIDFGNDTTTDISAGDFVAGLDGFDSAGNFIGELANAESKVPVGIAQLAIGGKANSGADANVVKRSVFVDGSHNVPSGDIDGSLSGAVDRQAVYLKWVSNQWKVTLEKTKWLVGTHHNGDVIFNFTGMHSSQDFADQIAATVPTFSGADDLSDTQDGLLVDDNGTVKRIGWKDFEADVEPIHTKPRVSLTGYIYSSQDPADHALVAGEFHLRATDINNVQLLGVAKSGDEAQFRALMTEGFQLEIETGSGNNRIWVVGVVGSVAVAGAAVQVNFVTGSVTKSTANFANDNTLTFNSYGRHPNWNNVEFERVPSDGYSSRKLASTQWTRNFLIDQRASLQEISSASNVDKFINPSDNFTYFTNANGQTDVTGISSTTAAPTANNQIYAATNGIYTLRVSTTTWGQISARAAIGSTIIVMDGGEVATRGTIIPTNYTVTVGAGFVTVTFRLGSAWESSASWKRNTAKTNLLLEFVGAAKAAADQRSREGEQFCGGEFGQCENTIATGNTVYAPTYRGTEARIGRYGPISANTNQRRLTNGTLSESLGDYLGFRAQLNRTYLVKITGGGVFNARNVSSGENYGMEFGFRFRYKPASSSTWSSFRDATGIDLVVNSHTVYDYLNVRRADNGGHNTRFGNDPRSGANNGVARLLSMYRGKFNSGGTGSLDSGPTWSMQFVVGPGPTAGFHPTVETDFEFDVVYASSDNGNSLGNVYAAYADLTAKLIY